LERAKARTGKTDRIESETLAFFERVRERYLARAAAEPSRIHVVDATGSREAVAARIQTLIRPILGR
jgi:dTMP kinase